MAKQNWVQALTEGLATFTGAINQRNARKEHEQRRAEYDARAEEDQTLQRAASDRAIESHDWERQRLQQKGGLVDAMTKAFSAVGLDDQGKTAAANALLQAGNDPNKAAELLQAQLQTLQAPPQGDPLDVNFSKQAYQQQVKDYAKQRSSHEGAITALKLLSQGQVLPAAADQAAAPAQPAVDQTQAANDQKWMELLQQLTQGPLDMSKMRMARQQAGMSVPLQGGSAR